METEGKTLATVRLRLAAIAAAHRLGGHPDPTSRPLVHGPRGRGGPAGHPAPGGGHRPGCQRLRAVGWTDLPQDQGGDEDGGPGRWLQRPFAPCGYGPGPERREAVDEAFVGTAGQLITRLASEMPARQVRGQPRGGIAGSVRTLRQIVLSELRNHLDCARRRRGAMFSS